MGATLKTATLLPRRRISTARLLRFSKKEIMALAINFEDLEADWSAIREQNIKIRTPQATPELRSPQYYGSLDISFESLEASWSAIRKQNIELRTPQATPEPPGSPSF